MIASGTRQAAIDANLGVSPIRRAAILPLPGVLNHVPLCCPLLNLKCEPRLRRIVIRVGIKLIECSGVVGKSLEKFSPTIDEPVGGTSFSPMLRAATGRANARAPPQNWVRGVVKMGNLHARA
jgi:hypothetical protein